MYVEKIGLTGSLFSIFLVECTFVLSEKYLHSYSLVSHPWVCLIFFGAAFFFCYFCHCGCST